MIGTRLRGIGGTIEGIPAPGCYWQANGVWFAMTPSGLLAGLANHTVTEHPDGTITVAPSIMVNRGTPNQWHGYLEAGVWREC